MPAVRGLFVSKSPLSLSYSQGLDRSITVAGIVGIIALGWWYLVDMDMMSLMVRGEWSRFDWLAMCLMWVVMMIAMMLPSALPMILMFQVISTRRQPRVNPLFAVSMFTLGYILAWVLFSVLATILQWWLQQLQLLTPMLDSQSALLSAGILAAAGIYQWLPLKNSCLAKCRTPVGFLIHHWRAGGTGGVTMGFHHGLFCLGCCWLLMLILFAGGVMNLLLVAGLAVFVLLEKVLPGRWPISRLGGVLMIGVAGYLVLAPA
jgi:predicted metal-binding membrane protein